MIQPSIQAESQTNSLIVKAEQQDWKEIEQIIKQVDVRRPQVLIEGALIEISPDEMMGWALNYFGQKLLIKIELHLEAVLILVFQI